MSLTYVVPDLHGRLDQLCEGLKRIATHAMSQAGTVIMLGDYVDKGRRANKSSTDCWQALPIAGNLSRSRATMTP
jgi:hypothetical protein